MENTVEAVVKVFREVCASAVEPDGMVFDVASVTGIVIKEEADYSGVWVTFRATLQNARVAMQADLGFADVVTPGPVQVDYLVLLEFPAPRVAAYPRETVVAEKFEAMVKLGELNSRMKDFYDLWLLAVAVARTFVNRNTAVVPNPLALTPAFAEIPGKESQWKGFIRKAKLTEAPGTLATVVAEMGGFLLPVAAAVAAGEDFRRTWRARGPWT
jgi:hypothetical protein